MIRYLTITETITIYQRVIAQSGGLVGIRNMGGSRRSVSSGICARSACARGAQSLEEALALYRGDFLADMDAGEWVIVQQEELRQRSIEASLTTGDIYFADARYAQAADVYRRLIALDPCLETTHRELMRCLARQGETSQAGRHYRTLSRLLLDELKTRPAPDTMLLCERLRRHDDM